VPTEPKWRISTWMAHCERVRASEAERAWTREPLPCDRTRMLGKPDSTRTLVESQRDERLAHPIPGLVLVFNGGAPRCGALIVPDEGLIFDMASSQETPTPP
jgi:hypothetical protein